MIRLGELDTRNPISCTADNSQCTQTQDFEIEKIVAHPLYDTPKYSNDIALIKLRRSSNETSKIRKTFLIYKY